MAKKDMEESSSIQSLFGNEEIKKKLNLILSYFNNKKNWKRIYIRILIVKRKERNFLKLKKYFDPMHS